jgi:hypothetical protein
MAGISASALLTAWEVGAQASPLDRALGLLWAAGHRGDLADWPLVARDRALLQLRMAMFGNEADVLATCPECDADLELALHLPALCDGMVAADPSETDGIVLRPLTSRDLAAVAPLAATDVPAALCARLADRPLPEDADVITHLEAREAERQFSLRMSCVDCGAVWTEFWDVAAHLWAEVDAASARLMIDVANLARAYGWTEAEVLALPPARRARYLDLAAVL